MAATGRRNDFTVKNTFLEVRSDSSPVTYNQTHRNTAPANVILEALQRLPPEFLEARGYNPACGNSRSERPVEPGVGGQRPSAPALLLDGITPRVASNGTPALAPPRRRLSNGMEVYANQTFPRRLSADAVAYDSASQGSGQSSENPTSQTPGRRRISWSSQVQPEFPRRLSADHGGSQMVPATPEHYWEHCWGRGHGDSVFLPAATPSSPGATPVGGTSSASIRAAHELLRSMAPGGSGPAHVHLPGHSAAETMQAATSDEPVQLLGPLQASTSSHSEPNSSSDFTALPPPMTVSIPSAAASSHSQPQQSGDLLAAPLTIHQAATPSQQQLLQQPPQPQQPQQQQPLQQASHPQQMQQSLPQQQQHQPQQQKQQKQHQPQQQQQRPVTRQSWQAPPGMEHLVPAEAVATRSSWGVQQQKSEQPAQAGDGRDQRLDAQSGTVGTSPGLYYQGNVAWVVPMPNSNSMFAGNSQAMGFNSGPGKSKLELSPLLPNGMPMPVGVQQTVSVGPAPATATASVSPTPRGSTSSTIAEDNFTTVMLRNIPVKYNREMVLGDLDQRGFRGCYDFFYLPIDFHTGNTVGYAFINFVSAAETDRFRGVYNGLKLSLDSPKICEVVIAKAQGKAKNVEQYRNSSVMSMDERFHPVVFEAGVRQPFPGPTRLLRPVKPRSKA